MIEYQPPVTPVPILQGPDWVRSEELRADIERATHRAALLGAKRLGDDDGVTEATAAYDAFMAEALERAAVVDVVPIDRSEWREIVAANPPREKDEDDQEYGFNLSAVSEVVVPKSVVQSQFPSLADRDKFLDSLPDAQFSKLFSAAAKPHLSAGADPKVRLSSLLDRSGDETSESPARLG